MFRRAAACALIAALTSVAWLGLLLDVSFDLRTKLGSDGRASVADALSSYALAGPAVVAVFAPRPGTPARSTAAVMVCSWWLAHASAALHSAHKGLLSYIADHAGINAALVFLLVTPTSSGRCALPRSASAPLADLTTSRQGGRFWVRFLPCMGFGHRPVGRGGVRRAARHL